MKFKGILLIFSLFIGSFLSLLAAETYNAGVMHDRATGGVSPGNVGYYNFTATGGKRQWISGTTPALTWKTNEYNGSITADTTFTFSDTPTDTNTYRRMHVLLVGDGSHKFTNTTDTIYWQTAVGLPQNGTNEYWFEWNAGVINAWLSPEPTSASIGIACSDETTAITAGTGKATFRMPYAMRVSSVRASLTTAQTSGNIFTIDINEGGTSIISTKLTIDNTEKTSTTAATAAVLSDTSIADDAEISIDIDQIGDGTAKGLKVWIIGTR